MDGLELLFGLLPARFGSLELFLELDRFGRFLGQAHTGVFDEGLHFGELGRDGLGLVHESHDFRVLGGDRRLRGGGAGLQAVLRFEKGLLEITAPGFQALRKS